MSLFKKTTTSEQTKLTKADEIENAIANLIENKTEINTQFDGSKYFGEVIKIEKDQTMILSFEDNVPIDILAHSKLVRFEYKLGHECYYGMLKYKKYIKEGTQTQFAFAIPTEIIRDPRFRYYRVIPLVNKPLHIKFIMMSRSKPMGEMVQFRIRDISIEGTTFTFPNINVPFYPGYPLKSISIDGLDQDFICDAKVRSVDRNTCTIMFNNLAEKQVDSLNQYIISVMYHQKKMKEERKADELLAISSEGETNDTATGIETAPPRKEPEIKHPIRILIIDNNPDESVTQIEKKFRVRFVNFEKFPLIFHTMMPNLVLFNPCYMKSYDTLKNLFQLNQEKNIPVWLIYSQISDSFINQIRDEFKIIEMVQLPLNLAEFEKKVLSLVTTM